MSMSTGPQSPFRGTSDKGRALQVVGTLFPLVSFVFVLARTIVRWKALKKLHADDWAIIVAQILAFGFVIESNLWAAKYGLGWTQSTLPPAQVIPSLKIFYAFEINWVLLSVSYKVAVLLLYRRIFGIVRSFKIALLVGEALTAGWFVAAMFLSIFQCIPVYAAWTPSSHQSAKCINGRGYCFGTGISNVLIDLFVLTIPMSMVWGLHLPAAKKVALTGVFLLGGLVVIAGILRINFLSEAEGLNLTGTVTTPCCWSVVEACVGIISACLPTLPALLFKSKSDSTQTKNTYLSGRKELSTYDHSTGASNRESKRDARSMGMALQGWNTEAYTEIGGSSESQSRGRSLDSDLEQQPQIPQAPFDPEHVIVTTAYTVRQTASIPDLGDGRRESQVEMPGALAPGNGI